METRYKKFVLCEHCKGLGKIEKEFVKEEGEDIIEEPKKGAKAVVDGKDLRFDEKKEAWKEEPTTVGNLKEEVKEDATKG